MAISHKHVFIVVPSILKSSISVVQAQFKGLKQTRLEGGFYGLEYIGSQGKLLERSFLLLSLRESETAPVQEKTQASLLPGPQLQSCQPFPTKQAFSNMFIHILCVGVAMVLL